MRVEEGFQPPPYIEGNPYTTDLVLQDLLKRLLPYTSLEEIDADLTRFGDVIIPKCRALSARAEPPKIIQYNQWGQRVDDLQTCEAWRGLKAIMQEEGVISSFYERKYGAHSRVYGYTKVLLATGDTQVIFCPLSMTDGCTRVLELLGNSELKRDIIPRLTSRDPTIAFTAGQWMTERPGGSDVSQTETVATAIPNVTSPYGPVYTINGFKWFSSATDSDVALALARTGPISAGSRSLSLFLVPLRRPLLRTPDELTPSALSNSIRIHRLKNKIGTKIVPTAELELNGSEAYLLGPLNQGVKCITPVLNITRLYSAISSVGYIRKALSIATAYSKVRTVSSGKQLLKDNALHVSVLAKVNLTYRALTHFTFGAAALLGKVECNVATEEEELRLRMMTPGVKAFAAHYSSMAMEECMAALGGMGYMEETGIGRLIDDGLVEKVWEGTIPVLSLDIVRAVSKAGVLEAYLKWAKETLSACPSTLQTKNASALLSIQQALDLLLKAYKQPVSPLATRPSLFLYSHTTSALNLLEHATWATNTAQPTAELDVEVFRRWVEEGSWGGSLASVAEEVKRTLEASADRVSADARVVYGDQAKSTVVEIARAHL